MIYYVQYKEKPKEIQLNCQELRVLLPDLHSFHQTWYHTVVMCAIEIQCSHAEHFQ